MGEGSDNREGHARARKDCFASTLFILFYFF